MPVKARQDKPDQYDSYRILTNDKGELVAAFKRINLYSSVWVSQGNYAVENRFKLDPEYVVNAAHLDALIHLSHGSHKDQTMMREAFTKITAKPALEPALKPTAQPAPSEPSAPVAVAPESQPPQAPKGLRARLCQGVRGFFGLKRS